jgi:hypothetical protein
MKKLHVNVTEEDIRNGNPWMSQSCPIALAIKREHPRAVVHASGGSILLENHWYLPRFIRKRLPETIYRTPQVAREFIHNFDNDMGPVEPIEFEAQEWK